MRAGAVGAGDGQNSHEFCYTEIDPKSIFTAEGRTDLTNAMRFVADNHPNIAWCSQWAGWLIWDSRRWAPELRCESMAMAQSTFRRLWSQVGPQIARAGSRAQVADALRWAAYTASTHGIAAMLAQAKPHLATIPDMYDLDPWLLNCPNGTLDLRTATLREHRREDHLTKLCPTDYRPGAECPTWLEFLDTIFAGDRATIDYLQRLCGYWLTGDVREQILPIFWGDGSNGKSTFVDAIKEVLGGDYAITADRSLIVAREREGHSTERMDLFGRRLAVVTETDDCQRFAEAAVKELTGGDAIRGRAFARTPGSTSRPTSCCW